MTVSRACVCESFVFNCFFMNSDALFSSCLQTWMLWVMETQIAFEGSELGWTKNIYLYLSGALNFIISFVAG